MGGNWKCNGKLSGVKELLAAFKGVGADPKAVDVAIFAPTLHIPMAQESLLGHAWGWVSIQGRPRKPGMSFFFDIDIDMFVYHRAVSSPMLIWRLRGEIS